MSSEEIYIKNIENGIRGLKMGTKTPSETNVGINLNKLKLVNEGMYIDLLNRYKEAINQYNKTN
jgi:hypothetical protein